MKCIAFGNSTSQLAVGGEDCSLKLVEWPSLRTKWDLRCSMSTELHRQYPGTAIAIWRLADLTHSLCHVQGLLPQSLGCCSVLHVLCRNEFGLKDALRDIDFSPGHKDKVSSRALRLGCPPRSCSKVHSASLALHHSLGCNVCQPAIVFSAQSACLSDLTTAAMLKSKGAMRMSEQVLVTTCEDGTCTLWQTDTGMCISSLSLPAGVVPAACHQCT